jgi:hypothetical protein
VIGAARGARCAARAAARPRARSRSPKPRAATGSAPTAVFRTSDSGRHWTPLLGVGTSDATGMAFSSATRGYLVFDRFGDVTTPSGFLMRTTDAGKTSTATATIRISTPVNAWWTRS